MKVFSIAFQSISEPTRTAMYSMVADDMANAYKMGLTRIIEEHGDLMWRPMMQTTIELDGNKKEKTISIDYTKNWLLNTIISNKDKKLFSASKKYISKNEQLLIKEKICKQ